MTGAEGSRIWSKWWFISAGTLIACILIVAIYYVFVVVVMNWPNTHATKRPLSLSEFKKEFGESDFPNSASNINFAVSSVGMTGRAKIYRFDAPVQDCLEYAGQQVKKNNSQAGQSEQVPTEPAAISAHPEPIDHSFLKSAYGLSDTSWFDVENIQHGFEGRGPPSGLSQFWIDSDRGRFYSCFW